MFDFQFYRSFFSHIGIAMHIIVVEIPRNSVLLVNNSSKKRWRENLGAILDFSVIPSKNEA